MLAACHREGGQMQQRRRAAPSQEGQAGNLLFLDDKSIGSRRAASSPEQRERRDAGTWSRSHCCACGSLGAPSPGRAGSAETKLAADEVESVLEPGCAHCCGASCQTLSFSSPSPLSFVWPSAHRPAGPNEIGVNVRLYRAGLPQGVRLRPSSRMSTSRWAASFLMLYFFTISPMS